MLNFPDRAIQLKESPAHKKLSNKISFGSRKFNVLAVDLALQRTPKDLPQLTGSRRNRAIAMNQDNEGQ